MSLIEIGMKVKIVDTAGVEHIGTISEINEVDTEYMVSATIENIEPKLLERNKHVSTIDWWPVKSSDIIE